MTSIERVAAVVRGQHPDRAPVSFWYHFSPEQAYGPSAVDAHLSHVNRYEIDFLKVMNDNPYPTKRSVRSAGDLRALPVLNGDEESFQRQLDLIHTLAGELKNKKYLVTTIFNAYAALRRIVEPPVSATHRPPDLSGTVTPVETRIGELLSEDRSAVAMALDAIAASLANFAKKCIEAGADGIFLSVRDEWLAGGNRGSGDYDELVRTGDGVILSAAGEGRLNMLHVCGLPQDFAAFCDYPVHAINWADRAGGPSIGEVVDQCKPAICGGVNNLSTLPTGTPEEVAAEVGDALRQAGDWPIMIAPGCTFAPEAVPDANLQAMIDAVR